MCVSVYVHAQKVGVSHTVMARTIRIKTDLLSREEAAAAHRTRGDLKKHHLIFFYDRILS